MTGIDVAVTKLVRVFTGTDPGTDTLATYPFFLIDKSAKVSGSPYASDHMSFIIIYRYADAGDLPKNYKRPDKIIVKLFHGRTP